VKLYVTAITLALLAVTPCGAEQIENVVSYTAYADGPCTGFDMIPAFIGTSTTWFSRDGSRGAHIMGPEETAGYPFPKENLWILGYGFTVEYPGLDPSYYPSTMAMAGVLNQLGGDYLVPKFSGPGTKQGMFPLGYGMALVYGDIVNHHVDMHVRCPAVQGAGWNGTLTIYTVPQRTNRH
jgi:hypothetical protein